MNKFECRIAQFFLYIGKAFIKWRRPELVKGAGSSGTLAYNIIARGIDNVLVVTGPNISKRGLADSMYESFDKNGIKYSIYNRTQNNPTTANVEEGYDIYRENKCQAIVAFGGGSPMDCAKAIGARVSNPASSLMSMAGMFKVKKKTPVFFAIPTTAGTGSEATVAAVITDENEHHKFTINDPKLIPDVAVLDPCITMNMPRHLTATTGMDALTHAVEAYTNILSGPTDRGAKYAVRLIFTYLPKVYKDGDDIAAREKMLEASYEAGIAFTRSCVGYVHAIAHTLGGLYGTPHGLANAVILPHILELYGKAVYKPLAELADAADISGSSDREKAENFIGAIRQMNRDMDIPEHLEIKDEDIPKMIKWAMAEANPVYPVPVIWNEADFRKTIDKIRGKI